MIFLSKNGPILVASFAVQLSTRDFLLNFCSFFWPLFSGENRVFALFSFSDGPETRGVRRFVLPKHGEKCVSCEKFAAKRGGHKGLEYVVPCFFFSCGVLGCLFFPHFFFCCCLLGQTTRKRSSRSRTRRKFERRRRRRRKKEEKEKKKKKEKFFSSCCCPLFFFFVCLFLFPGKNKKKKEEKKEEKKKILRRRGRTRRKKQNGRRIRRRRRRSRTQGEKLEKEGVKN